MFMSKTYLKLSNEWIELFHQLNQENVKYRNEAILESALDYADDVVPETAEENHYDSAICFFYAVYYIWRKDHSITRIKLKNIDKLAENLMENLLQSLEIDLRKKTTNDVRA